MINILLHFVTKVNIYVNFYKDVILFFHLKNLEI